MFRKTLIAAAIATAALTSGSAYAADNAVATSGDYKQYIQKIANRSDYERCNRFSIRVFNACLEQAGGNSQKIRSCRSHYQNNVVRCQGLSR